jgi:glycosyltransferase involved in cell wall biosynthesis
MNLARTRVGVVSKAPEMPPDRNMSTSQAAGFGRTPRAALRSLSVVIPCFNEADNLEKLLPRLQKMLASVVPDWEVILVDDGSRDRTADLLATWSGIPGFQAIQLSRNFGKEVALTAGLDVANGQATVLLDADLQHPPELIPTLVAKWQEGYDVVYAVREHRRDESALKRLGARWFYRLMNLGGRFDIPPDAGDFRLMDRAAVDALVSLPERNRFMKGLYAWVGLETAEITYMPEARGAGRSTFSPLRLLALSVDGLTSFTTWPLRAVSAAGFGLALLALLYGAYLVIDYFLHGQPIPGYTTIVVGLALLSGLQLIALGVLGEYVSRIFEEVKGRPLYVVKHRAGRRLHPEQE